MNHRLALVQPGCITLLIKLMLVMGAVLLGGANRFLVMPGLIASLRSGDVSADKSMRRFTLTAAILSSTSPLAAG
jgi:hypothetical protein